MKRALVLSLLGFFANISYGKPMEDCSTRTRIYADKLLELHVDNDERMEIDPKVKQVSPIMNPFGKGKFSVEEIWGDVYKGKYRMRFIYAKIEGECILIGQEILEFLPRI
jgi:hypothetical protein